MIYLRNTGDYVIKLQVKGLLTNASYAYSEPIPFPSYLKAVWAIESTAGTTGVESVDLKYSATAAASGLATLVSSGTLFSFASTATSATYNTANLTTNPPVFAQGGILGIAVTTVHTTTAGSDLIVMAVIARERGVIAPAVQTGTYSADMDAIS
jgi:hypothetical protein